MDSSITYVDLSDVDSIDLTDEGISHTFLTQHYLTILYLNKLVFFIVRTTIISTTPKLSQKERCSTRRTTTTTPVQLNRRDGLARRH